MPTGRLRVLVIDDAPMNLVVLADMLNMLGHDARSAASAASGLEALRVEAFDLVITDVHMPDMDGRELLRTLHTWNQRIPPVVALSADVTSRRPHEYRRLGFAAFLAKPVTLADLRLVFAAVRGAPPTVAPKQATLNLG